MRPAQPAGQNSVGKPWSKLTRGATVMTLEQGDGVDRATDCITDRASHSLDFVADLAGCRLVKRAPQIRGDIDQHRLADQRRDRTRCQCSPGKQHTAGRSNVVAGTGEQQRVAQRRFVLDPAGAFRRCRCRRQCQALPPDAGPSLLPAHHRVEGGQRRGRGKRSVFNRVRTGRRGAQPGRHGSGQRSQGCTDGHRCMAKQFRAQNHRRQDDPSRRFWQRKWPKAAAPCRQFKTNDKP